MHISHITLSGCGYTLQISHYGFDRVLQEKKSRTCSIWFFNYKQKCFFDPLIPARLAVVILVLATAPGDACFALFLLLRFAVLAPLLLNLRTQTLRYVRVSTVVCVRTRVCVCLCLHARVHVYVRVCVYVRSCCCVLDPALMVLPHLFLESLSAHDNS